MMLLLMKVEIMKENWQISKMCEHRIEPKTLRPKTFPWEHPTEPLPPWAYEWRNGIWAKCPKCNRVTTLRICYGCKEIMCEVCLKEHQIICLHNGSK